MTDPGIWGGGGLGGLAEGAQFPKYLYYQSIWPGLNAIAVVLRSS